MVGKERVFPSRKNLHFVCQSRTSGQVFRKALLYCHPVTCYIASPPPQPSVCLQLIFQLWGGAAVPDGTMKWYMVSRKRNAQSHPRMEVSRVTPNPTYLNGTEVNCKTTELEVPLLNEVHSSFNRKQPLQSAPFYSSVGQFQLLQ